MHLYIKLFLLVTGLSLCSIIYAQQQPDSISTTTIPSDTTFNLAHAQQTGLITDSLISFAKRYLRKPYNYRPNPQVRFDCSGFSSYVYDHFGFKLKRSSAEQATQFRNIERTELKTGDLVFFSGRRINNHVGHVGIVVNAYENGKFDFIHSSNQSGIVISRSTEDYYARRYIKAGRVIDDYLIATAQTDMAQNTPEEAFAINTETPPEEKNTQSEPKPAVYHHVKKGDTLYSIARRYGITVNTLKKQNKLTSDKILPKQKLIITEQAG